VIVPPMWEGDRNDLALAAAAAHPDRLAVMGRFSLDPALSHGLLSRWRDQTNMFGARLVFHRPAFRPLLAERRVDWLWEEAEAADVPLMVLVDPEQLGSIAEICERHPRLRLTLDHLAAYSGRKGEAAFAGLDRLVQMARFPNISVKATALPSYAEDDYPYRSLHPVLRRVHSAFGPRRIFWGTDFTRLKCSYREAVTMITEGIDWLSNEDKRLIMGEGVCAWLGWPLPAAGA
jgi:L-fuconolactonase